MTEKNTICIVAMHAYKPMMQSHITVMQASDILMQIYIAAVQACAAPM